MNIVLIGPPASGKGTQAACLAAAIGGEHISTGALLRTEIQAGTALGERIGALVASGALVDDETITALVAARVLVTAERSGYVLDGYPRSLAQARALASAAPPHVVIALDVPEPVLIERVSRRAHTEGRADDTADVITHRLHVFAESTRPVLQWFRRHGLLRTVDGDAAPDIVAQAILDAVHEVAAPS